MRPTVSNDKLDWYAADPTHFFEGTSLYDFEVKGRYRLVLDLIYKSPKCMLPDVSATIARLLGCSTRSWNIARDVLVKDGKLVVVDGHLTNPRASAYWQEHMPVIQRNRAKLAENAKDKLPQKLDLKLDLKNNVPQQQGLDLGETPQKGLYARAKSLEVESEEESSSTLNARVIVEVETIAKALGQTRGRYWEKDYRAMIQNEGLTFDDVLAAARSHTGEPIRSITRLRGLAKRKRDDRVAGLRPSEPDTVHADSIPRDDWKTALVNLAHRGVWNAARFGELPGTPGNTVPDDLEQSFLVGWRAQGCHPVEELDASENFVRYPADRPDPERRQRWSRIA